MCSCKSASCLKKQDEGLGLGFFFLFYNSLYTMWLSWSHSILVGHWLIYVKRNLALIRDNLQKKREIYATKVLWHLITGIGIKMNENEEGIYEVQFSMISNLNYSHISGNLRAWHSTPPPLERPLWLDFLSLFNMQSSPCSSCQPAGCPSHPFFHSSAQF